MFLRFTYGVCVNFHYPPPFKEFSGINFVVKFMLVVLACLHYYWFYLFLKMLYAVVAKGETEDKIN